MKDYYAKFGHFGGGIYDDKLFRQMAKALETGVDIPRFVERRREHEKWLAEQQRELEEDMRLNPQDYVEEPEPELTAEEQAELKAREAKDAVLCLLKHALGREVEAARKLAKSTNDVRVTGGYNYDLYRKAVDHFIVMHKAANQAWKAYHEVKRRRTRGSG